MNAPSAPEPRGEENDVVRVLRAHASAAGSYADGFTKPSAIEMANWAHTMQVASDTIAHLTRERDEALGNLYDLLRYVGVAAQEYADNDEIPPSIPMEDLSMKAQALAAITHPASETRG